MLCCCCSKYPDSVVSTLIPSHLLIEPKSLISNFIVKLLHDSVGQGVILCNDDHVIDIKTNNCSAKVFMFKVNAWILATLFELALQEKCVNKFVS